MTDELKPCPLCGSEVGWVSGSIRCSRCGLSYGAPVSKEKVKHRWNTRAERTCSRTPVTWSGDENDSLVISWLCSECGHLLGENANYCSNCGARVVR